MKTVFAFLVLLLSQVAFAAGPLVQPANGMYWNPASKELVALQMLNERDVLGSLMRVTSRGPEWQYFKGPLTGASLEAIALGLPIAELRSSPLVKRTTSLDLQVGRVTLRFVSGAAVDVRIDSGAWLRFQLVKTSELAAPSKESIEGLLEFEVVEGMGTTEDARATFLVERASPRNLAASDRTLYRIRAQGDPISGVSTNLLDDLASDVLLMQWNEAQQVGTVRAYRVDPLTQNYIEQRFGFQGRILRSADGFLAVGTRFSLLGAVSVVLDVDKR